MSKKVYLIQPYVYTASFFGHVKGSTHKRRPQSGGGGYPLRTRGRGASDADVRIIDVKLQNLWCVRTDKGSKGSILCERILWTTPKQINNYVYSQTENFILNNPRER